jgi:hypothetical protein
MMLLDVIGKQELKIKGTCKQEPKNVTRGVSHYGLAIYIKKCILRQKRKN